MAQKVWQVQEQLKDIRAEVQKKRLQLQWDSCAVCGGHVHYDYRPETFMSEDARIECGRCDDCGGQSPERRYLLH